MKKINLENVNFRKIGLEDLDYILNLEKEQNLSISSRNALLDSFNENSLLYYVCIYNNEVIGYFGISLIDNFIDILSILVKKDFQNIGIGKLLLEKIIQISELKNIEKIFLEVRKSNIIAQNLYKKYGFELINIRKNYYPDNSEDALILMKKIK